MSGMGLSFSASRSSEAVGHAAAASKIKSGGQPGALYAYPREKSIQHFKDQIRALTRRKAPDHDAELIEQINPVIRGWGDYYKGPRPNALQPTRPMDRAAHLVASVQALAQQWMEEVFRQPSCTASMGLSTLFA